MISCNILILLLKLIVITLILMLLIFKDARSEPKYEEDSKKSILYRAFKQENKGFLRQSERKLVNTANDTRKGVCVYTSNNYIISYEEIWQVFDIKNKKRRVYKSQRCCVNPNNICQRRELTTRLPVLKETKKRQDKEKCCKGYKQAATLYDSMGRLFCVASCKTPCVHGTCAEPDICKCNKSYKKSNVNHVCSPICKPGTCNYGICVAPNVCQCNKGYVNTKSDTCIADCSIPCVNATCVGGNICKCNEGYRPHRTAKHICIPHCDLCLLGFCVKPGVCVCPKGYKYKKGRCSSKNRCTHYCGEHGRCLPPKSPMKCLCDENYKYDGYKQLCVPICSNCTNGICKKPHVCECGVGYLSDGEGGCKFKCDFDCGWGKCVAMNKCECNKGYVFNLTAEGAKCVPYCPGCEIGQCFGPYICQCPDGYVYAIPKKSSETENRCLKTEPKNRYYDHEQCKKLYEERRLKYAKEQYEKEQIRKEEERKQKIKEESERLKRERERLINERKRMLLEKEQEERERQEKEQRDKEKKARLKQYLWKAKTKWLKKQEIEFHKQEKQQEQQEKKLKQEYVQYKKYNTEPEVTWRNFARVAVGSLFLGPLGIIFW